MTKNREVLNAILADLISDLELDQVIHLQKTILEMTAANNAKFANAFVKFENEIASEMVERIDIGDTALPQSPVSEFESMQVRESDADLTTAALLKIRELRKPQQTIIVNVA